jgi:diaminohydroxyphosphoribosylaminopyrimidine deaminase / 5-amino-6-(5-phosphoribosylamino)uracil reductase
MFIKSCQFSPSIYAWGFIFTKGGSFVQSEHYMKLALSMADSTRGQTSPNPAVGAVVVKDGEVVGMGAHLKPGEGHAEVNALDQAGEKAEGADIYVTLEPCSHFGKTPPCSNLIIDRKIKRVFIACTDPNPLVAGQGIKRLKEAGIEVHTGMCEQEALEINKHFFHFIQCKTPYVTLKTASTLDGKTATADGDSKWITSESSRKDVHYDRHRHDAILVGVNTVIQDNPHLTTRLPQGGKNPIRIILDTHLRTPIESNVVQDNESKTIIITGKNVSKEEVERYESDYCEIVPLDNSKLTIQEVLEELGKRSITSLYVEGGSSIHYSFLEEAAFQELVVYLAPKLVGGKEAFTSFGGRGFSSIAEGQEVEILSTEKLENDIKIIAVPKKCNQ